MQRHQLQALSREELLREAERAGIPRPRVLTQAELVDEILKRTAGSDRDRARARGWLGRARDLLATVVEKGLHMPDAAAAIRSGPRGWPPPPPPLPTVTLAEIYAAQGHVERAVAVLDEVLAREPDHQEARELRDRLQAQLARGPKGASEPPVSSVPATEPSIDRSEPPPAKADEEEREEPVASRPPSAPPALGAAAPAVAEAVASDPALAITADDLPAAAGAEAPAPEALPERYEVDEVVALAVDPSTFYVYWEVRPTTFAHMVAGAPAGGLALRVTAVTPGWEGPIVETRDVRIDALHGDHFIHHVRPRADVRVSVGWIADGRFDPIAVGAEVSAPRAFVAAGAPAPAGVPLDLSEGLHGPHGEGFARPVTFAGRARTRERLAAGFVPRDLSGATMEAPMGASPADTGPATWLWVPVSGAAAPGASALSITFGPIPAAPSASAMMTASRWGGASELGPWGGASEAAPRWGGASEAAGIG